MVIIVARLADMVFAILFWACLAFAHVVLRYVIIGANPHHVLSREPDRDLVADPTLKLIEHLQLLRRG